MTISPGFAAKQARLAGSKIESSNPGAATSAGKVEFNKPGLPSFKGGGSSGTNGSKMAMLMRLRAAMRTGAYQNGGDAQRDQLASAGGKPFGGAPSQIDETPKGF